MGRDGHPGRDGPRGNASLPDKDGNKEKKNLQDLSIEVATYTRWGSRTCPSGAQLVYTELTGGNIWNSKVGGAILLCMPTDPE